MEKEIDEIFLHSEEPTPDTARIASLVQCTAKIPHLYPYIDLLLEETEAIRAHFSVYDVQLTALAEDLREIEAETRALEAKNRCGTAVYERLKGLCIALSLDNEHFRILENGSFSGADDLGRMQRSLDVLSGVALDRYTIRVVREKRDEITQSERNFLKRFVIFLSKLFIRSESTGELRVHRALYASMLRYKFIFAFSRKYEDYYSVLCSAYVTHSKNMYEKEFDNHLDSIEELVDDPQKLQLCIDVLTKSYRSLIECETSFMRDMGIDGSVEPIFKNISSMVIEFIDSMFKKSKLATVISTGAILAMPESECAHYEEFRKELGRKYRVMEELFFKAERKARIDRPRIEYLNSILASECADSLKEQLEAIYIDALVRDDGEPSVEETIVRLQLLCSITSTGSKLKDAIKKMMTRLPRLVIEFVFSEDDEIASVKKLIGAVDADKSGAAEVLRELRQILLSNANEGDRRRIDRLFSKLDE